MYTLFLVFAFSGSIRDLDSDQWTVRESAEQYLNRWSYFAYPILSSWSPDSPEQATRLRRLLRPCLFTDVPMIHFMGWEQDTKPNCRAFDCTGEKTLLESSVPEWAKWLCRSDINGWVTYWESKEATRRLLTGLADAGVPRWVLLYWQDYGKEREARMFPEWF